jgi:hypothetical protein
MRQILDDSDADDLLIIRDFFAQIVNHLLIYSSWGDGDTWQVESFI